MLRNCARPASANAGRWGARRKETSSDPQALAEVHRGSGLSPLLRRDRRGHSLPGSHRARSPRLPVTLPALTPPAAPQMEHAKGRSHIWSRASVPASERGRENWRVMGSDRERRRLHLSRISRERPGARKAQGRMEGRARAPASEPVEGQSGHEQAPTTQREGEGESTKDAGEGTQAQRAGT